MKKIAILGGGENQIPLIKASKNLGYYLIICDFRAEIPGRKFADSYYEIDATNYEDVLRVCAMENIDGILSNSEYTVQVANKVAMALGLIGNTSNSIDNIMSKSLFRKTQRTANVFYPQSSVVSSIGELFFYIGKMTFPIIIKPCESSGTRGTARFDSFNEREISICFEECKVLSRDNLVVVEEFVKMPSLTTIEGDVFLYENSILWDGLFHTTRSSLLPLVPMTYTAPLSIEEETHNKIKCTVEKVIKCAGLQFGEFNIEGYFNEKGDFFIIEINARQGGHELPYYLQEFSGIDYNRLLVSCSVGDNSYWKEINSRKRSFKYSTMHTVFSYKEGIYDGLSINQSILPNITRIKEFTSNGCEVLKGVNGSGMLALVNLSFNSFEEQYSVFEKLDSLITVRLK